MGLLDRLKVIVKGEAKAESPVVFDPVPVPIQKEQGFFSKANNIMDYEEEAPAIESSNLSAHERYVFPIEVEYNGFFLQAMDEEQLKMYMARVDNKETEGLTTVAEFARKYLPVLDEEVEKYENDIENMPAFYKQLPKTKYPKSKTAKLPLKAAQAFTEDTSLPVEDLGTQLGNVEEIHLSNVNMAFINRPESDTRKFEEFNADWEAKQKENKITKAMNLLKGEQDAEIIE